MSILISHINLSDKKEKNLKEFGGIIDWPYEIEK